MTSAPSSTREFARQLDTWETVGFFSAAIGAITLIGGLLVGLRMALTKHLAVAAGNDVALRRTDLGLGLTVAFLSVMLAALAGCLAGAIFVYSRPRRAELAELLRRERESEAHEGW